MSHIPSEIQYKNAADMNACTLVYSLIYKYTDTDLYTQCKNIADVNIYKTIYL